ncbi:MAG: hypothetical protein N2316_00525 [Spirochaetes bacterium]|nr:hypothetical protein [Spirochaetota bacterium]
MARKKIIGYVCVAFMGVIASEAFSITGEEALAKFRARMESISTMRGTISWTDESGFMYTGNFKYMAPNKIYVKFISPSGKIIAANGRKLYVYNASTNICGIQDLGGGGSGGISALVSGYMAIAFGGPSGYTIKLSSNEKHYTNITLVTDGNFLLKKAILKTKTGGGTTISLSGIIIGEGISPGIFDFNVPPGAQVVNNPLNIR